MRDSVTPSADRKLRKAETHPKGAVAGARWRECRQTCVVMPVVAVVDFAGLRLMRQPDLRQTSPAVTLCRVTSRGSLPPQTKSTERRNAPFGGGGGGASGEVSPEASEVEPRRLLPDRMVVY